MDKKEFLKALDVALQPIDKNEREQTLAYYEEIINDRCDSGMSEEEAVYSLGSIEEITRPILEDAGIDTDSVESNYKMSIWDAIKTIFIGFCIVCLNIWAWALDITMWSSGILYILSGLFRMVSSKAMFAGLGLISWACALALCVPFVKLTKWSYARIKEYIFKLKAFFEGFGGNK
ncbi:MAG: DUF1700 domain-containing protein [Clostridia bacterium]|nr:DUF1700 domain-containing protein [Clostridia bacterium]